MSGPTPPDTSESANSALTKIQERLLQKTQEKAELERRLEFANKTPEQMRVFVKEQMREGRSTNRNLAQQVVLHEKGDEIKDRRLGSKFEKMTREEIIEEAIGVIVRGEQRGLSKIFEAPDEKSEETATKRRAQAEELALYEGMMGDIVLEMFKTQPKEAATLLGRIYTATKSNPDAIPEHLKVELGQKLEELAKPQNKPGKQDLEAALSLSGVTDIDKIIPGYGGSIKQIQEMIDVIKTEEKRIEDAKKQKEKQEKHEEREKTLEKDTVEGAKKQARESFHHNISLDSQTSVDLGESGKEGYLTHLDVLLKSPVIKEALLSEARLNSSRLTISTDQLNALLTIQANEDLMNEAVKYLSENVSVDWTGYTKADYEAVGQNGKWEEVWRNHLENTINGYALGMIEEASQLKNNDTVAKEIIESGMNILFGETSLIEITTEAADGNFDEVIYRKFGKGSNQAKAVIRFSQMLGSFDSSMIDKILDNESLRVDEARTDGIRQKLKKFVKGRDARKEKAQTVQKELTDAMKDLEASGGETEEHLLRLRIAELDLESLKHLQENHHLLDVNDFLTVGYRRGSYRNQDNFKYISVDMPVLEVNEKQFKKLTERKLEFVRKLEFIKGDESQATSIRQSIASIDNELRIFDSLRSQLEDINSDYNLKHRHGKGRNSLFITESAIKYRTKRGLKISSDENAQLSESIKNARGELPRIKKEIADLKSRIGEATLTEIRREEIKKEMFRLSKEYRQVIEKISGIERRIHGTAFADEISDFLFQECLADKFKGKLFAEESPDRNDEGVDLIKT